MTDDSGVMGNLPRSRPGRRSEKRAAEVKPKTTRAQGAKPKKAASSKAAGGGKAATARGRKAAAGTGAKARASAPRAAGSKAGSKPRATASKPRSVGARARGPAGTSPTPGLGGEERAPRTAVREERVESPQGTDPITAALRLGMAVGDAGLKAVAKIVERLPRP